MEQRAFQNDCVCHCTGEWKKSTQRGIQKLILRASARENNDIHRLWYKVSFIVMVTMSRDKIPHGLLLHVQYSLNE